MAKRGMFYRYWILAACFVCLCVFSGVGMWAFGIFFKPVMHEFGWSRASVSLAFTVMYLVQGLFQPVAGRVTDRYGPRKVIFVGAFVTGAGFVLLTLTGSLWNYYLFYGVVGIGLAPLGLIPVSTLISNWFTERRGTALGIVTTGIGVGGIVFSPFIGTYLIPDYGWSPSFFILALVIWLVILPVALLVIRDRPRAGAPPQPESLADKGRVVVSHPPDQDSWTLNRAIKTSTFWLIVLGFLLTNLTSIGIFQHQVNHFTDIGLSTAVAAASLSLVGLGSTIGKVSFGFLSDRFRPSYCAAISFAFQAMSIVVLLSVKSEALVWLYAVLMGIGMGGWAPLIPQLVSANFGTTSFGIILGTMRLVQNFGIILGPLVAGYAYDVMHTYHWVFVVFLALYAVATPSIIAARHSTTPPVPRP